MKTLKTDSAKMFMIVVAGIVLAALITPLVLYAAQGPAQWINELARSSMSRVFVRICEIILFILLISLGKTISLNSLSELGLKPNKNTKRDIIFGIKTGFYAFLILSVFVYYFDARIWAPPAFSFKTVSKLISFIFGAFAVAIAEEVLFRAILFGRLIKDMRPALAAPIAAFVFAASHFLKSDRIQLETINALSGFTLIKEIVTYKLQSPQTLLPTLIGLFILGLIMCMCYAKTKNIWLAAAVHFALVAAAQTNSLFSDSVKPVSIFLGSRMHINGICGWVILGAMAIWIHSRTKTDRKNS